MIGRIVVHGGSGTWRTDIRKAVAGVREAASSGARILAKGGSALNAVEAAVATMEDNAVFNAGRGSTLTLTGTVEMDAGIMDGRDLSAGAVALVRKVKNPVRLAHLIMENTDHVLLAGTPAERFAAAFSLPQMNPITWKRRRLLMKLRRGYRYPWLPWIQKNSQLVREHPEILKHETVGAVAVDAERNFAAAASTGGITMKLPGRIGDTPLIGAGLYCDNRSGAATATGMGEVAIRLAISRWVCSMMEEGVSAERASSRSIRAASMRLKGYAGVIAIDRSGRIAAVHNTPFMPWAFSTTRMRKPDAHPSGRIVAPIA